MHKTVGLCLLTAASVASSPLAATSQVTAQTHIAHVVSGFPGAPNGAALLGVAEADAAVAVEHSRLAGSDRTDVGPMVRHARHVLHALGASTIATGPGSGFGVGPAADAIAQHIELAAAAEGATEGVRQHSVHVAAAARAVSARAAAMRELANQIIRTSDYVAAYDLVRQLQGLAAQLVSGADSSGDGSIALAEGGLEHVRTHMGLMTGAAAR